MEKRGVLASVILGILLTILTINILSPSALADMSPPSGIILTQCLTEESSSASLPTSGYPGTANICLPIQAQQATSGQSAPTEFPIVEQWFVRFTFNNEYLDHLIQILQEEEAASEDRRLKALLKKTVAQLEVRKIGITEAERTKARKIAELEQIRAQLNFRGEDIATEESLSNQKKGIEAQIAGLTENLRGASSALTDITNEIESLETKGTTIPSTLSNRQGILASDLKNDQRLISQANEQIKRINQQIKALPDLLENEKKLQGEIEDIILGESFVAGEIARVEKELENIPDKISKGSEESGLSARHVLLEAELLKIKTESKPPRFSTTAEATCFLYGNTGRCAVGPLNIIPPEMGCSGNIVLDIDILEVDKGWKRWTIARPLRRAGFLAEDKELIAQIGGVNPQVNVPGQNQCPDYFLKSLGGNAKTNSKKSREVIEGRIIPFVSTNLVPPSVTQGGKAALIIAPDASGRNDLPTNIDWVAWRTGTYEGVNVAQGIFPEHYKKLFEYIGQEIQPTSEPIGEVKNAENQKIFVPTFGTKLGFRPGLLTKIKDFPSRVVGGIFSFITAGLTGELTPFLKKNTIEACLESPDENCCKKFKIEEMPKCKDAKKGGLLARTWRGLRRGGEVVADFLLGNAPEKKSPVSESEQVAESLQGKITETISKLNVDQKAQLARCKEEKLIAPSTSYGAGEPLIQVVTELGTITPPVSALARDSKCLCEILSTSAEKSKFCPASKDYWADASDKIKDACAKDSDLGAWDKLDNQKKKECFDKYADNEWLSKIGALATIKSKQEGSGSSGASATTGTPGDTEAKAKDEEKTSKSASSTQTPATSQTATSPARPKAIPLYSATQPYSATLRPTGFVGPATAKLPIFHVVADHATTASGGQPLGGAGAGTPGVPDGKLPQGSSVISGGGGGPTTTAKVTDKPAGTKVTATPKEDGDLSVSTGCANPTAGCDGGNVEVTIADPNIEGHNKIIRFNVDPVAAAQSAPVQTGRSNAEVTSLFILVSLLIVLGAVSWYYFKEKKEQSA